MRTAALFQHPSRVSPGATIAPGAGLTYHPRIDSADCSGLWACVDLYIRTGRHVARDEKGYLCCNPTENATCGCIPDVFVVCTRKEDCEDGESCLDSAADPPRCVSSAVLADFGGEATRAEEDACVDAGALLHPRDRIWYTKGIAAPWYCVTLMEAARRPGIWSGGAEARGNHDEEILCRSRMHSRRTARE